MLWRRLLARWRLADNAGHGPPSRQRRKIGGVRNGGFFVLATALPTFAKATAGKPVLAALGEDAGEQGLAGFKRRVVVGRVP